MLNCIIFKESSWFLARTMLLCHCAFYLLLPSAVKYSINDNITVLIWHTANLLRFSKTTSILKIMVWVMRLFFPFNSVFSLSIFLKEAHFNSSVEIRFMEGGCFCKLALSVHLQELFSLRVLKRFLFFFLGFFFVHHGEDFLSFLLFSTLSVHPCATDDTNWCFL